MCRQERGSVPTIERITSPPDTSPVQTWPHLRLAVRETCDKPLVSVVMATFNCEEFVGAALESALAQTYQPLEVVVVDDASTDGTYEVLRVFDDPRLRLHRNERRLGHAGNRNRALEMAQGPLIKFLDHDDALEPDCVDEMARVFALDPAIGLVFARRRIIVSAEEDAHADVWLEHNEVLHTAAGELDLISDGRDLLGRWLTSGQSRNWIGEPTAVMVSRSHLEHVGGFGLRTSQLIDWDLWARLLSHCLVGFVDRELVAYRIGHDSETTRNTRTHRAWLDRLWIYEALWRDPEVRATYPDLALDLRAERRQAWRTVVKLGHGANGFRVPISSYGPYAVFRLSSLLGRSQPLFAEVSPVRPL
jgi:glycosyltransferase involved in cell wall biosynthesis